VVAYFQVVPLLKQRFSSGHNEPLKERFLRPCNRGVSVVEKCVRLQGDYVEK